jgi:predicted AAA+ superfamily ATPase
MELVKQATWNPTPVELYFYRDTDKREVDLVVEAASGDLAAIEAKSATVVRASDTRGLRLLRDKLGGRFKAGIIVYTGEHTLPIADRIWAVPVSGLWA